MDLKTKLYRSTTDKILTGVCGGISEYVSMDSTVLRLIWVLVVAFTGFVPGVVVYVIAAIIMPIKPASATTEAPSTSV